MVITAFGGKKNSGRSRKTTMAMMLTGRILLCHVISLALVLLIISIGQDYRVISCLLYILGIYLLGDWSTKAGRIR
jgi:hypothetical protein